MNGEGGRGKGEGIGIKTERKNEEGGRKEKGRGLDVYIRDSREAERPTVIKMGLITQWCNTHYSMNVLPDQQTSLTCSFVGDPPDPPDILFPPPPPPPNGGNRKVTEVASLHLMWTIFIDP